jgi:hypothetical protein
MNSAVLELIVCSYFIQSSVLLRSICAINQIFVDDHQLTSSSSILSSSPRTPGKKLIKGDRRGTASTLFPVDSTTSPNSSGKTFPAQSSSPSPFVERKTSYYTTWCIKTKKYLYC